ncbi:tyrosine-type recombinase/integrase [Luteipulveratus mongoliensis]|uniref:Integrase n=1 Tax=Luteipulveratus mongoliensis TaxID=571913 RepID=A0A0K1JGS8_9MICO|nr:site-specific integrase [Luteipulveratus mongoliensis]AKU15790.1 hypothetical protein VV02_07845 [Luteipulveratus mongoliensis]
MARSKGTGSVFEKEPGNWCYQIDVGFTASGGRRRVTKTRFATRKAAEAGLAKANREYAAKGVPEITAKMTVRRWSEEWLKQYVRHARPDSYTTAASAVKCHIVPAIGKVQLANLTPAHVRAVQDAALRDGANSTSTALRVHANLITMLNAARAEGHTVPQNAFSVRRPPRAESDRDAIPLPDALALLEVASKRPDAARWVAALLEGMRPAECRGLTWAAIDFDKKTIDVSWQLKRLPYLDKKAGTFRVPDAYEAKQLKGAAHLVRPKTSKGKRVVPMVPWLVAALMKWREDAPKNEHGLVWAEEGRPMRAVVDRAAWVALNDEAQVARVEDDEGRRYDLYEARHTTATLLLEAGIDPHVITAILGHSSIVVSRGYQHVSQEMSRKALETVAERLQLTAPE